MTRTKRLIRKIFLNPAAVVIVSAIVLGHLFNKGINIGLVKINLPFVLVAVTRSPSALKHIKQTNFDLVETEIS